MFLALVNCKIGIRRIHKQLPVFDKFFVTTFLRVLEYGSVYWDLSCYIYGYVQIPRLKEPNNKKALEYIVLLHFNVYNLYLYFAIAE